MIANVLIRQTMQDAQRQIERVTIVADFLATRSSEQASTLRWLYPLLKGPLEAALGPLSVSCDVSASFSQSSFLLCANAKGDPEDIHRWFDAAALSDAAKALVKGAIAPGTLLVGYELSSSTRQTLDACSIPWVDIWLHPVRFASDILFAFRASDGRINRRLLHHRHEDQALRVEAERISRSLEEDLFTHPTIDAAFLFAGQLPRDKSLLRDGRFQTLLDHRDAFAELAGRVSHIYYLDHPKLGRPEPEIVDFLDGFPNVSRSEVPSYQLLADPRIVGVAALSSSLCEEARFFKKAALRFLSPTVPLEGAEAYVGTFQKLPCADFWSEILQDVAPVKDTAAYPLPDPGKKLRDALGFHWAEQKLPENREPSPENRLSSFDLFDTLITRRYARAEHIFHAISSNAAPLLSIAPQDFVAARQTAEKSARAVAAAEGREEPRIAEIYAAFPSAPDPQTVDALVALELEEELAAVRPVPQGKRAIAVVQEPLILSDTPHSADSCARLLEKAGYSGWGRIVTSGDCGKTKRTGKLFSEILQSLKEKPETLDHRGDNLESDVRRARAAGACADHFPSLGDALRRDFPTLGPALNRLESNVQSGLIVKAAALAIAENAESASRAWRIGALCLGPLLSGFALWLRHSAKSAGVHRLGFLTREGQIMRRCFDAICPEFETFDVVASRQIATRCATLQGDSFVAQIDQVAHGETVASWCRRFSGIVPEPALLSKLGIGSPDDVIGMTCSKQNLRMLAEEMAENAVRGNTELAHDYTRYLNDLELGANNSAIVDIGYRGTMQSAMGALLDVTLRGYYLAIAPQTEAAQAYLTDRFNRSGSRQIERNRTVYETLLCSAGGTYTGMEWEQGRWVGRRDVRGDDRNRTQFVKRAHDGAVAMTRMLAEIAPEIVEAQIEPELANLPLASLLANPDPAHARLIGRLTFDDPSASAAATPLANLDRTRASIWQEGARVLKTSKASQRRARRGPAWSWRGAYGFLGWRHLLTPIVAIAIARIGQPHDVDHYRDDPIGFFRRLSDPNYRRIGRWLYPRD